MYNKHIKAVYFLGIGGIGMSALARYFLSKGIVTGGYDRTPTTLTQSLTSEGAWVHYIDDITQVPESFLDPVHTLIIYTPAIPSTHTEFSYFKEHHFEVQKRAQVLGTLTQMHLGLCIAGTHGKTTTSAMTAHLLQQSHVGCNAFLGGITKNYNTNFLLNPQSDYVVIEADEFDRSFHYLHPFASVITSADPDHLDIYGTPEAYCESFEHYTSLLSSHGFLIIHHSLSLHTRQPANTKVYTYGRTQGDFHAENISIGNGKITFDFISPICNVAGISLGVPVSINIDNGIAAMALAQIAGATPEELHKGMASFEGVVRRFDFKINTPQCVLLADYAHHPEEIKQSIASIQEVFQGRKVTGIFQPHLFSRTQDFYGDFAQSLSTLDEIILLDIYPAREQPIPGVSSQLIYDKLPPKQHKHMCKKEELLQLLSTLETDVLMVLGAGDVETMMTPIEKLLVNK